MKRCVLFLLLVLSTPSIARADDVVGTPAQQPVGVFTHDNGKTIVVGIGTEKPAATLDVYKGEIKIGSSGASCTKELAGMIRFSGDQLQVCNSHGWQSLAAVALTK